MSSSPRHPRRAAAASVAAATELRRKPPLLFDVDGRCHRLTSTFVVVSRRRILLRWRGASAQRTAEVKTGTRN